MKNRTIIIIGAFMLAGAVCGSLAGWGVERIELRKLQRDSAFRTYDLFRRLGFSNYPEDLVTWKRELGDELQRTLAQPWSATSSESDWGTAYLTMRDLDRKTWGYTEGMPPDRQDETIRYLCFRIEKAAGANDSFPGSRAEFQALVSYPTETINRNRDKIARAIQTATLSHFYEVKDLALAYVAYLTESEWGRELCWQCLERAVTPSEINLLTLLLIHLDQQAKGELGLTDSLLNSGKPSTQAQTGAAEVLARFLRTDWQYCDTGNRAIIQAWKNALMASASRPATQPGR